MDKVSFSSQKPELRASKANHHLRTPAGDPAAPRLQADRLAFGNGSSPQAPKAAPRPSARQAVGAALSIVTAPLWAPIGVLARTIGNVGVSAWNGKFEPKQDTLKAVAHVKQEFAGFVAILRRA